MVCAPGGEGFADTRQNETWIESFRVRDAVKNSGPSQGRADTFRGLVANYYSLKTEETPAGRLALVDWLGSYRAGIFTWYAVQELSGSGQGNSRQRLLWGSVTSKGDLGTGFHICGLGKKPLHLWSWYRAPQLEKLRNDSITSLNFHRTISFVMQPVNFLAETWSLLLSGC